MTCCCSPWPFYIFAISLDHVRRAQSLHQLLAVPGMTVDREVVQRKIMTSTAMLIRHKSQEKGQNIFPQIFMALVAEFEMNKSLTAPRFR